MMTRRFIALLLAACAAVAGCSAQAHINQGDQAAALFRHGEAARHYQEALGVEPKLAQAPAFLAKLHHAQSRAAFEEGRNLARQQAWDQAVDRLAQAAKIDPPFQEEAAALAQTRRDASRWHLERALAEADRGQLEAALTLARRAADFDPANDAAKQAAASGQDGAAPAAPAGDLFRQGTAAWQDKRWPEAIGAFEQVRTAAPHHLLTRVRVQQAQAQWDQARRLAGEGQTHLEAGRLDQALTALRKSLELWPFHEQAKALLAQATQRAAEVERLAEQARKLTAEQRYDEAIAAARAALALWPTHGPAQEARSSQLLSEARQQEARGETVEALETSVCAALALEPVQPEEAARLLKALRQRMTGAATARP